MSTATGLSPVMRLVKACKPNTWIKALSGAAVVWMFLPRDETPASRIHEMFRREAWREGGWPERVVLVVGFVFWLPAVAVLVVRGTRQCGARVRRDCGVSIPRQIAQQLRLALGSAIAPPWYYVFELHDDERRRRALEYLYRFETKAGLYELLRRYLSSAETSEALSNKAAFALRCRRQGVEAISALATVDGGAITRLDGNGSGLPHQDLFFKPLRG